MAGTTLTLRSEWIAAGLRALGSGGPAAVRVEALAAGMGVSKGGFYGHFADRPTFLRLVLDEWERRSISDVLDRVEGEGGDGRTKILRAGRLTLSPELAPVDLAVRDWAQRDPAVAERLRRVDEARLGYLRRLFSTFIEDADDIEARCVLALTFAIGQHLVAVDRAAIECAARRLLAPGLDPGPGSTAATSTRVVRATSLIGAPCGRIFELIADPARQPEWDGNDNLATAAEGQRVRAVGDVFDTVLTGGGVRRNHVVEFEEARRIAWRPSEPDAAPPGHLWRWELEPEGVAATLVTHTYDWTDLVDETRLARARATTPDRLAASLDRLGSLATATGGDLRS